MLGHDPLPPALSDALLETGYCVAPGAASLPWCRAVRSEVEALDAAGLLERSLNRLATGPGGAGELVEKVGVREASLVQGGLANDSLLHAPVLRAWWQDGGCASSVAAAARACEQPLRRHSRLHAPPVRRRRAAGCPAGGCAVAAPGSTRRDEGADERWPGRCLPAPRAHEQASVCARVTLA